MQGRYVTLVGSTSYTTRPEEAHD